MSSPDLVIDTRGLTKRYKSAQALAGLDLNVPRSRFGGAPPMSARTAAPGPE